MSKWEKATLRKLGNTYTGLSGKNSADFGDGLPYIPYMNVFANTTINSQFLEYVKIEKGERQNRVQIGDVLFTTSSETPEEVGMSSVLTEDLGELYLNSFCFGFRLKNPEMFNKTFLGYLLRGRTLRHQMFISAQGSTRYNLSKKNFYRVSFGYPADTAEQRKIAEVLSTVDEVIEKTTAIIEKYTSIKRGLMQTLITKGEEVDISTLCKTKSGGTPSRNVQEYFMGDIPWVTTGELNDSYIFYSSENISLNAIYNSSAKIFPKGTVLMAMYGATIGKLGILAVDAATNQACCAFFCNEKINSKYLYYKLFFMRNEFIALGSGAGQQNISQKVIKHIRIKVPKIEIQIEIASQLTAADEKIETERNYLAKLQNLKKGLMQDLLTNKVSVEALLKEGII